MLLLSKVDSTPTGLADSQIQPRCLHSCQGGHIPLCPDHITDGKLSQESWAVCQLREFVVRNILLISSKFEEYL